MAEKPKKKKIAAEETPPTPGEALDAGLVEFAKTSRGASGSWGPPAATPTGLGALSTAIPDKLTPQASPNLQFASTPTTQPSFNTALRATAPKMAGPGFSAGPKSGQDVLALLQQAAPELAQSAAPEPQGPDPVLEMISKRQQALTDQLKAASAAAAPQQPTVWDAIGKLAAGVTPLAVGAIAGQASGLGTGAGLGIGAGVGSEALRRMDDQDIAQKKEEREAARENLRFARQQAAGSEEESLRYAIAERGHARGREESQQDFKRSLAAEIAKEGRGFEYDKAKAALDNAYKIGQISLSQSLEIEKELIKKDMDRSLQMGDDPEMNDLMLQFGDDKEAIKQGREDLERERFYQAAVKDGGNLDQLAKKVQDLQSKHWVKGSGQLAAMTGGVTRYGREMEELNSDIQKIAFAVMSSKGEDAKFSKEKMSALVSPFLMSPRLSIDENIGNLQQLKESLGTLKGESALLSQAGAHPGIPVVSEAAYRDMTREQRIKFVTGGGKVKRANGRLE